MYTSSSLVFFGIPVKSLYFVIVCATAHCILWQHDWFFWGCLRVPVDKVLVGVLESYSVIQSYVILLMMPPHNSGQGASRQIFWQCLPYVILLRIPPDTSGLGINSLSYSVCLYACCFSSLFSEGLWCTDQCEARAWQGPGDVFEKQTCHWHQNDRSACDKGGCRISLKYTLHHIFFPFPTQRIVVLVLGSFGKLRERKRILKQKPFVLQNYPWCIHVYS